MIQVEYEDLAFEVDYDYYPARPGVMTLPNGDPGYPPEPATMEVTGVKMVHPKDPKIKAVDVYDQLSDTMLDWFEEQVEDYINGDEPDFGLNDPTYM